MQDFDLGQRRTLNILQEAWRTIQKLIKERLSKRFQAALKNKGRTKY